MSGAWLPSEQELASVVTSWLPSPPPDPCSLECQDTRLDTFPNINHMPIESSYTVDDYTWTAPNPQPFLTDEQIIAGCPGWGTVV